MSAEAFVCKLEAIPKGARQLVKVGKRNIAVYNVKGNLFAIDNACYHHGGPLLNGDIEEMGGHPCVVCPWHSYKISLQSGEGFYMGVEAGASGKMAPCVKSKGVKQRTHRVEVRNGNEVYVIVDISGDKIESDTYAEMALANKELGTGGVAVGGGGTPGLHSGYQRSGHVLNGGAPSGGNRLGNVPFGTQKNTGAQDVLKVKCMKVVDASENGDTKTFVFEKAEGRSAPRLEPGMWVTLAVPINGGEEQRRTWTISSIRGELGGWFAITVKLCWPPQGRGGSSWLHQHATEGASLTVLEHGGTFTVNKLRTPINTRRGALLMLSAGIGITPMFASVHRALTDPFTTVSGPPLHITHIHVDRTLDAVPLLNPLSQYHHEFCARSPLKDPVSYKLQLFLTKQSEEDAFTASPKDNTNNYAPAVQSVPMRFSSRPTAKGIKEMLITHYDQMKLVKHHEEDGEMSINITVMLCGPQLFMENMMDLLAGIGVDRNNVITEEFDF